MSSDISSSDILPRSIRTSNSLPFTGSYRQKDDKKFRGRHRTYTQSNDANYVIHELPNYSQNQEHGHKPHSDYDRRIAIEEVYLIKCIF